MNVVLDTHVLIWFPRDPGRISARARELMVNPSNQCFISIASAWEMAIKIGLSKLDLGMPADIFFSRQVLNHGFVELPISIEHVKVLGSLPQTSHRDPFDRMIVSQAIADNMVLVSNDLQLDQYDVNRIW